MELLNYFFSAIIVFVSLFFGLLLGLNSPEELKVGKKYFYWLKLIFFGLFVVFGVINLKLNLFFEIISVLVLFYLYYFLNNDVFAMIFSVAFLILINFLNSSSLIFSFVSLLLFSLIVGIDFVAWTGNVKDNKLLKRERKRILELFFKKYFVVFVVIILMTIIMLALNWVIK